MPAAAGMTAGSAFCRQCQTVYVTRFAKPADAVRHAQAPGRVRIVGGQWKRTPIPLPAVAGLRPTPDRVRETVFNWLAHLRPDFAALRVLDLFAGSGALGFEAASRGVMRVTLVERDARALAALRALRDKLRAGHLEFVAGDALAVAARLPAASFDLVFLDPPFASGLLPRALVASLRLLGRGGLIYVESGTALAAAALDTLGLRTVRYGRAGQVHVHLLARRED